MRPQNRYLATPLVFANHLMNAVIVRYARIFILTAGLLEMLVPIAAAQTVTLVVNNESNQTLSFTPQLTVLPPSGSGEATLTAGTTPITVGPNDTNNQVSVTFNANPGPVTVTLQLDGSFAETPFAFIQVFGTSGQGIVSYNLGTTRPFDNPSVLAPSGQANFTITLTIASNPVILPTTTWRVNQLVVQKDGTNFFAKGVAYSPTPIGGATFEPGIGDWFVPPWWTYDGDNSPNDIGRRDTEILTGMGVNALRTYFTWYWLKQPELAYLQNITQDTPMTVFEDTQYPYTVFFDHTPFLDACYKHRIYVILGIAVEGGNCFNFDTPDVMSAYQNFYLQTAQKLATLYGRHPAVIGFCMGNEQNNAGINTDSRVYVYYQQMYNAIKTAAPDKLVTIAFQDDPTLYNGTQTVRDPSGQTPPTPFNNLPIEQAISLVVDVWGLNIYAGMSTDFPIYRTNVIQAGNGAYARPLWITEWGTPSGENVPEGATGPTQGNAQTQQLSPEDLANGAKSITADIQYMHTNLGFVAGAFYFEYTDEWWKNASFDPTQVDTDVSRFDPDTGKFETNPQGQVTMLNDSLQYPAYPFTHDGSASPDWPEESWGLYGVATNNEEPQNPNPNNPDILTPRQPYVAALSTGYATLAAAYASENPSSVGDRSRSRLVSRRYGHFETPWGVAARDSSSARVWNVDPFGLMKVLKYDQRKGITALLLDWDREKVFLPRSRPEFIYFFSTDEWKFVQEDANVTPRSRLPVFLLTPPADSQFSEPFELPEGQEHWAIPSAPVPETPVPEN
jgi:hypothetical protein